MSAVSLSQRQAEWVTGPAPYPVPILSEVFSTVATDSAGVAFALAHIRRSEALILWAQDRLSAKEAGQPYLHGLGPARAFLKVDPARAVDVMWAMEEGLRCQTLTAVIGEVWGDSSALSFTATKRLAFLAEQNGVPCWLIRHAATPDLSAARNRWRVASLPSLPNPDDPRAPGAPRWQAELFRSRHVKPGAWVVQTDAATGRPHFSAPVRAGVLDTASRPQLHRVRG